MSKEKETGKKEEVAEGLKGMGEMSKKDEKTTNKPSSSEPAEISESEVDALKKELEAEREKSKNLAEIIEKVSSKTGVTDPPQAEPVEPKLKELEKKLSDQFQTQLKELKDSIASIGAKIEKASKTEKPEEEKIKKIVDKMQSETTSKISALEDTIKKISDRLTAPEAASSGGEEVSKGLAALGGSIELKSDLERVKKSLKELEKTLAETRDENEIRFTRIKEQMKRLEKIPSLEERVQALIEKLGPENVEKLKKLVFSTEELSNQVIPEEIRKALSKELSPFTGDIESLKNNSAKLNDRLKRVYNEISYLKNEMKNLYKLGDQISSLQSDRDKTRQDVKEREAKLLERISGLENKLKEKIQEISENIKNFEKDYSDFVEELVNKLFRDNFESKLSEVKDKTSKELTSVKDEMDVIASRFYQFENVINPTIEMIKEQIGEFEKTLERVKKTQESLNLDVEKSIEKKFAEVSKPALSEMEDKISKATETVGERIDDLESELSQFKEIVSPTLEMFRKDLGKFEGRLDKFNESQSNLSDKLKEIKMENKELSKAVGSIERLEESIETLDEKTKEIDDLRKLLDKRTGELDSKLKTLDEGLAAQKEFLGRVDKIEKVLDDFSIEISKLHDTSAALEKDIEDNKNLFEEGLEEVKNKISQFENVVRPALDLFRNNLAEFAETIEGFKEKQAKMKDEMKDIRTNEKETSKKLGMLESYVQNIPQLQKGIEYLESSKKSFAGKFEKMNERIRMLGERISYARKSIEAFADKWKEVKTVENLLEKMDKRVSKLEKEIATTRAQFDNVVEQSLMDRKKLEEMTRKQKERIKSLLSELRG